MSDILHSIELVGDSPFCEHIRSQVKILASYDLPILITGETGTGKDVIARMIHNASNRSGKTFLSMNCATLGSLAESELFGHVSGAFTGAVRGTRGYVGSADGGTLVLDEIGEMPLTVQAKLLRFLDSGEYFRVGESNPRSVDVRIIASTNQDLEVLCREKKFREDLYFRISGAVLRTVPLSRRPEDIPALVRHFIRLYCGKSGSAPLEVSAEAMDYLVRRSWPGNVRQLKHTVFRLCHMAKGQNICMDAIQAAAMLDSSSTALSSEKFCHDESLSSLMLNERGELAKYRQAKERVLAEFDRMYFSTLLKTTRGRLKESLEMAGMHKKNFYNKLKILGLAPKQFRTQSSSRCGAESRLSP